MSASISSSAAASSPSSISASLASATSASATSATSAAVAAAAAATAAAAAVVSAITDVTVVAICGGGVDRPRPTNLSRPLLSRERPRRDGAVGATDDVAVHATSAGGTSTQSELSRRTSEGTLIGAGRAGRTERAAEGGGDDCIGDRRPVDRVWRGIGLRPFTSGAFRGVPARHASCTVAGMPCSSIASPAGAP